MISTGAKVKLTVLKEMMKNNKGTKGIAKVTLTAMGMDSVANLVGDLAKKGYFDSVKSHVTASIKEKQE